VGKERNVSLQLIKDIAKNAISDLKSWGPLGKYKKNLKRFWSVLVQTGKNNDITNFTGLSL
jgi:hypothetical protein